MSTKSEVRAEAATENVIEERLQAVAEMVIFGASRREVTLFTRAQWGLGRRTAQEYLKRVQERLAREAGTQDRLFYLKLSQLQRDRLVGLALRYAQENLDHLDARVLQTLAGMITAARGLLDSRDRAAGEIHSLVTEQRQGRELAAAAPAPKAPVEDERHSPAGNGGELDACEPAPPSPSAVERLVRGESPKRKSNGRKDIQPNKEEPESRYPDCADCAGGGERQPMAPVTG